MCVITSFNSTIQPHFLLRPNSSLLFLTMVAGGCYIYDFILLSFYINVVCFQVLSLSAELSSTLNLVKGQLSLYRCVSVTDLGASSESREFSSESYLSWGERITLAPNGSPFFSFPETEWSTESETSVLTESFGLSKESAFSASDPTSSKFEKLRGLKKLSFFLQSEGLRTRSDSSLSGSQYFSASFAYKWVIFLL